VRGEPEPVDEVRAKEILSEEEFEVKVDLGLGNESAKYWTCDFSYVGFSAFDPLKEMMTRDNYRSTCGSMGITGVKRRASNVLSIRSNSIYWCDSYQWLSHCCWGAGVDLISDVLSTLSLIRSLASDCHGSPHTEIRDV
jgi:hypothetical protein